MRQQLPLKKVMTMGRRVPKNTKKTQKKGSGKGSNDTCGVCGRPNTPEPMDALMAAGTRFAMTSAIGPERGDMMAYLHAKSTVLLTASNQDSFCECDIRNWDAAQDEYESKGAAACWAALGVDEHVMLQAEAESFSSRLDEGQVLTDADKQRMIELEAYFRQHEERGGDGIFAHRPKSPPRDPNRKRAKLVESSDADPLFPFEEYIEQKYGGEDPNEVLGALCELEDHGLAKAAAATGHSQEWIEGWARLYGSEQVFRDLDFSNPFVRALLELSKLHPEDFRDLWEDEEAIQAQMEATPVGRHNTIVAGFPFVRGREETAELASERDLSRQFRATRKSRPIQVE